MDKFNSLVEIVKDAMPLVNSAIPALTGGFITAMFLRGNTRRSEFEKIKAGKVKEAINELVQNRELTLTELVKCKNLVKIAELADQEYTKRSENNASDNTPFDFDWFLRFFESAGNVSNEDMQLLWARILCDEYQKRGSFSFRTLELLRNLSKNEGLLFKSCSRFRIETPYEEVFLLNSEETFSKSDVDTDLNELIVDDNSDWIQILALAYKLSHDKVSMLEEMGILSSILVTSHLTIEKNEPTKLFNSTAVIEIRLKAECPYDDLEFDMLGFRFTDSAIQLFSVIDSQPALEFVLDAARLIEHYHKDFDVKVFEIFEKDSEGNVYYDDDYDILHSSKYFNISQLPNLNKLDEEIKNSGACNWK